MSARIPCRMCVALKKILLLAVGAFNTDPEGAAVGRCSCWCWTGRDVSLFSAEMGLSFSSRASRACDTVLVRSAGASADALMWIGLCAQAAAQLRATAAAVVPVLGIINVGASSASGGSDGWRVADAPGCQSVKVHACALQRRRSARSVQPE